jgi:TonB family protein
LATLAGPVTAGILSNNIKHSTLKNRFTMMTKTNNRKPATFRLALAIVAVTLVSFGVFISACQTGGKKAETEKAEQETIVVPSEQITDEEKPVIENPEDEYVEIQRGDSTYKMKAYDANSGTYIIVQEQPTFAGGDEARIKYIKENIKYPEEARAKGIQGTVFVTFVVEANGSISGVRLLRGIGGGCDEESVRLIENMPRWVPGKQRGQAVRVQFNMPIRFVLE